MPGRSFPPMPDNMEQWCSNALTKVCSRWPAPGWTVIPVALLMTINRRLRTESLTELLPARFVLFGWRFCDFDFVSRSPGWCGRAVAPRHEQSRRGLLWMRERENSGSDLTRKRSDASGHALWHDQFERVGVRLSLSTPLRPPFASNSSMLQSISIRLKEVVHDGNVLECGACSMPAVMNLCTGGLRNCGQKSAATNFRSFVPVETLVQCEWAQCIRRATHNWSGSLPLKLLHKNLEQSRSRCSIATRGTHCCLVNHPNVVQISLLEWTTASFMS